MTLVWTEGSPYPIRVQKGEMSYVYNPGTLQNPFPGPVPGPFLIGEKVSLLSEGNARTPLMYSSANMIELGLEDLSTRDEDWPLIVASKEYPSNCIRVEDYKDRDVQLIFVRHKKNFMIHSQIAKMHSSILKTMIDECHASHIVNGNRVIILARTTEDTLSQVNWNRIEDVLKAMYNSHDFHDTSSGLNLAEWRQVMKISNYLDLHILLNQFKRSVYSAISRYPQGPWVGLPFEAYDLIAGDLGIDYRESLTDPIYQMLAKARWSDKKTQQQLASLFPYSECCHVFQQYAIPRMISLQMAVNTAVDRILKENKDDSYLIKTSDLLKTLEGLKKDDTYVFNMIYNHSLTCVHCKEVERDKKRKRKQEEEDTQNKQQKDTSTKEKETEKDESGSEDDDVRTAAEIREDGQLEMVR